VLPVEDRHVDAARVDFLDDARVVGAVEGEAPGSRCGFRLAIKTDPGGRVIRDWSIVPAASTNATWHKSCWKPGRRHVTC